MAEQKKIGAVGDMDSVMLFQALGIDVFGATDAEQTEHTIHRLAREGYAVIFITEKAAALAEKAVEYYKTQTFPAIIPIPDKDGTTGFGMEKIHKDVEKAIGADILFGEGR